jgi:hypothetical protein
MPQSLSQAITPRYAGLYQTARLGLGGVVANQVGATTSVGLATTYTGLCLSNPAGSGKNLVLFHVSGNLIVAPAAVTSFMLIGGWSAAGVVTHTTPLTPLSSLLGGTATLVAKADAAATLVGTPAYIRALGQTTGATANLGFATAIEGGILIAPGGYVAIGSNIAGPASGLIGAFMWSEEAA